MSLEKHEESEGRERPRRGAYRNAAKSAQRLPQGGAARYRRTRGASEATRVGPQRAGRVRKRACVIKSRKVPGTCLWEARHEKIGMRCAGGHRDRFQRGRSRPRGGRMRSKRRGGARGPRRAKRGAA